MPLDEPQPPSRRFVSPTKLAELLGVSIVRIGQLRKSRIGDASSVAGIYIDHPSVVALFQDRGLPPPSTNVPIYEMLKPGRFTPDKGPASRGRKKGEASEIRPRKPRKSAATTGNEDYVPPARRGSTPAGPSTKGRPVDVSDYLDMTLRTILDDFGTEKDFKDYLAACKNIEDIRAKRIENAMEEGRLVARDLVETHIMSAFEQVCVRLLRDQARTIVARVGAAARAGQTEEELVRMTRGLMTAVLKPAVAQMEKAMKAVLQ